MRRAARLGVEESGERLLERLFAHPGFQSVLMRAQQMRDAGDEVAAAEYMRHYMEGAIRAFSEDPDLAQAMEQAEALRAEGRHAEAERLEESYWDRFVAHLMTGGRRRRWRVWLETGEPGPVSLHMLESDAKEAVRTALDGLLKRAEFQLDVFRPALIERHEGYYYNALNAVDEVRRLLREGNVWDAWAAWDMFQRYDDGYGLEHGGEITPPPLWINIGRLHVEAE